MQVQYMAYAVLILCVSPLSGHLQTVKTIYHHQTFSPFWPHRFSFLMSKISVK